MRGIINLVNQSAQIQWGLFDKWGKLSWIYFSIVLSLAIPVIVFGAYAQTSLYNTSVFEIAIMSLAVLFAHFVFGILGGSICSK
jgi:hypothetical protein